nr:MAG TPA: hypothetical protein [Bacteriophage sp.]
MVTPALAPFKELFSNITVNGSTKVAPSSAVILLIIPRTVP